MTTTTPRFGITIPNADGSDPADLTALLRALGLDVENKMPGIAALATAARTALTGAAKFAGRTVFDSGDTYHWATDGTSWWPLAKLAADKSLPMGGQKITGLGAGTTASDAVNKAQLDTTAAAASSAASAAASAASAAQSTANGAASAASAAQSTANGRVSKSGDTMTGPLTLPGAPSEADHAATKAYVDAKATVSGVLVAMTDASGLLTQSLPAVPAGKSGWSVVATGDSQFFLVSVSGATATMQAYALTGGGPYQLAPLASTMVRVHWHATAY